MWIWLKRLFESRKAREARLNVAAATLREREREFEHALVMRLVELRRTTFVPAPPRQEQYRRKQHEADSRAKLRQPAPAARYSRRKDDEPRDTMAGTYLDPTNPLNIAGLSPYTYEPPAQPNSFTPIYEDQLRIDTSSSCDIPDLGRAAGPRQAE